MSSVKVQFLYPNLKKNHLLVLISFLSHIDRSLIVDLKMSWGDTFGRRVVTRRPRRSLRGWSTLLSLTPSLPSSLCPLLLLGICTHPSWSLVRIKFTFIWTPNYLSRVRCKTFTFTTELVPPCVHRNTRFFFFFSKFFPRRLTGDVLLITCIST